MTAKELIYKKQSAKKSDNVGTEIALDIGTAFAAAIKDLFKTVESDKTITLSQREMEDIKYIEKCLNENSLKEPAAPIKKMTAKERKQADAFHKKVTKEIEKGLFEEVRKQQKQLKRKDNPSRELPPPIKPDGCGCCDCADDCYCPCNCVPNKQITNPVVFGSNMASVINQQIKQNGKARFAAPIEQIDPALIKNCTVETVGQTSPTEQDDSKFDWQQETPNQQELSRLNQLPPDIIKSAEALDKYIQSGRVKQEDLNELIKYGLEKDVVDYWKYLLNPYNISIKESAAKLHTPSWEQDQATQSNELKDQLIFAFDPAGNPITETQKNELINAVKKQVEVEKQLQKEFSFPTDGYYNNLILKKEIKQDQIVKDELANIEIELHRSKLQLKKLQDLQGDIEQRMLFVKDKSDICNPSELLSSIDNLIDHYQDEHKSTIDFLTKLGNIRFQVSKEKDKEANKLKEEKYQQWLSRQPPDKRNKIEQRAEEAKQQTVEPEVTTELTTPQKRADKRGSVGVFRRADG